MSRYNMDCSPRFNDRLFIHRIKEGFHLMFFCPFVLMQRPAHLNKNNCVIIAYGKVELPTTVRLIIKDLVSLLSKMDEHDIF